MSVRRLRAGEYVAIAGCVCVVLSLLLPAYHSPIGDLDAWQTFGPAVALTFAALFAGLAMIVSAMTERSPALPIATAVWCVPVSLIAVIAAVVRVLERPDNASSVATGAWLELIGTCVILMGAWLSMRDERTSLYSPATPEPRPRP
jgi:hypothetical protein